MTPTIDDCEHVVTQLWDYLDGRLPEHERARVLAHLAWCVNCSSHYVFEQSFLETVGKLRREDRDFDDVRARVLDVLRAHGLRDV